jgi:putative transposase
VGAKSADTIGFAFFENPIRFITVAWCARSQPDDPLAATIHGMSNHPTRYYGNGDLHFITSSCYRRQPWLGTPRRRDLFLTVLEQVRRRYQFVVVGYVVMPEHIHLLISEPQERTPSTAMQALKLAFARRVLGPMRQRRKPGQSTLFEHSPKHIWQKRFYDFNVWSARKRIEKLRYMHRNPVKRGLVESPELWGWSSYRAYAFGESGPVRVNDWDVLKMKVRKPSA